MFKIFSPTINLFNLNVSFNDTMSNVTLPRDAPRNRNRGNLEYKPIENMGLHLPRAEEWVHNLQKEYKENTIIPAMFKSPDIDILYIHEVSRWLQQAILPPTETLRGLRGDPHSHPRLIASGHSGSLSVAFLKGIHNWIFQELANHLPVYQKSFIFEESFNGRDAITKGVEYLEAQGYNPSYLGISSLGQHWPNFEEVGISFIGWFDPPYRQANSLFTQHTDKFESLTIIREEQLRPKCYHIFDLNEFCKIRVVPPKDPENPLAVQWFVHKKKPDRIGVEVTLPYQVEIKNETAGLIIPTEQIDTRRALCRWCGKFGGNTFAS